MTWSPEAKKGMTMKFRSARRQAEWQQRNTDFEAAIGRAYIEYVDQPLMDDNEAFNALEEAYLAWQKHQEKKP